MNETLQTIVDRRSIRGYKPEQIKDQELAEIVKAGQFAPSAMNQQSWHFSVIQNRDLLNKINAIVKEAMLKADNPEMVNRAKAENFNVFYAAPTLIVVSGDTNAIAPQYDGTLALGNMFLAAASLGVGSCWIHAIPRVFNTEFGKPVFKELGIPEGYQIYCAGAFGYHAGAAPAAAPRKEGTVQIIK